MTETNPEKIRLEKRDLNMIALAYFELFSPFKPKPSRTQLRYWVKKFRENENHDT